MRAEFLVRPIRSIKGFEPTSPERTKGADALLREILAPVRGGERRYPVNVVIYGGASKEAESLAQTARDAALPGDAIWRVGEPSVEPSEREFWVHEDYPALALINAKALYIPDGRAYANVRRSWTNRADVEFSQDRPPRFHAANGYTEAAGANSRADQLARVQSTLRSFATLTFNPVRQLAFQGGPAPPDTEITVDWKLEAKGISSDVVLVKVATTNQSLRGSRVRLALIDPRTQEVIDHTEALLNQENQMEFEWRIQPKELFEQEKPPSQLPEELQVVAYSL